MRQKGQSLNMKKKKLFCNYYLLNLHDAINKAKIPSPIRNLKKPKGIY